MTTTTSTQGTPPVASDRDPASWDNHLRDTVLAMVRRELAVVLPDVPLDADPDADLKVDLDVDSLALLELVARMEYLVGVAVPDEDWTLLTSMTALVDYLVVHGARP